ncbi:MAG: aminotransferase class V-fold PLP-dependent enzyme, partial [Planctomycetota bacterium]
ELLLTPMEHHSNLVPWFQLAERTGAVIRHVPMTDDGRLDLAGLDGVLTERTKLVAFTAVSNALGTINPVADVVRLAHAVGAVVLIDGAQATPHVDLDVQALDVDFFALSAHKMYGPTGIGALYAKRELLNAMPPWQGGGDMILSVNFERTVYNEVPYKFEAGTPNIAGVIGLGAAIDYVGRVGYDVIEQLEADLLAYATEKLSTIDRLKIIGTAKHKAAVVSFVIEGVSSLDIGMHLDRLGVAVRTGHHCAQPIMDELGIAGTTRASFAFYNTPEEVDVMVEGLRELVSEQATIASDTTASDAGELQWPDPTADSVEAAAAELIETFSFLREAGEDPTDEILGMGKKIPPMPASEKNDATHVKGCMSQVWLTARPRPGTDDAMDILADSDAEIVKGLIGLLQTVASGQSAASIATYDFEKLLRDLNFQSIISV